MVIPLSFGQRPTQVEPLGSLCDALGIELHMKREDRIDDLGCGSKVRKIAHELAAAAALGAQVIVTSGSAQSNQCKAVAAYAPRAGMRAHLVYGGDEQRRPEVPTGNYLLTGLMRPTVTWFDRWPWARMAEKVLEVAAAHERAGERPYVIGPGGSSWPSLLGPVELGRELVGQMAERGRRRGHIVAVAGTGETCVGLALASAMARAAWTVHGIVIAGDAAARERTEAALVALWRERGRIPVEPDRVRFHGFAAGGGYDRHAPDELDFAAGLARDHGLLFDPNYMAKAARGLVGLVERGAIARGEVVVLLHSGGSHGLFADTPDLRGWAADRP